MYTNERIRLDSAFYITPRLQVERIGRPDLEQVVGLAGDVMAFLDLGQLAEGLGQVRGLILGPGDWRDPAKGEEAFRPIARGIETRA